MASSSTKLSTRINFVEPDMDNGCESGSCELAKLFYNKNERVVRRLRFRRELSDFYIATFADWATPAVIGNPNLHRTFSQVLFALVNDGKVLRISNSRLNWANNSSHRQQNHRQQNHRQQNHRQQNHRHGQHQHSSQDHHQ